MQVNIGTVRINNSKCEKLLGIIIDCKLNYDGHIGIICKKAGGKLNALNKVAQYMNTGKKCFIMNAFFSSQYNYRLHTWMSHNRSLNHKINRLHEKCLLVIYNDGHSFYDELLNLDNSVSIHHKHLEILAT